MNLQTIAEHTVDMDLLPEKGNILDAGCRGFEFTRYFRSLGHHLFPIDIDVLHGDNYFRFALTRKKGYVGIVVTKDPHAMHIKENGNDVIGVTLGDICDIQEIDGWDLIKLDIEGSEYEVIMSMDRSYATQISVEFHMHCGQTEAQVQQCVDKLHSLGYRTIQHEKTPRHGLKANYWDSLFCL